MAITKEVPKEIIDYLEKNLKKGYKLEDLKWALINQKHSRAEVERAIKAIESKKPVESKDTPKIEIIDSNTDMPTKIEDDGFFRRILNKFRR